jgi:dolichyl-diphosphooligosaccharide--protein glycosyltransferase
MSSRLRTPLKKIFRQGRFSKIFKKVGLKSSKGGVIFSICLISIVILAILIRIQPLNWGYTLSEFDPFFHYSLAKQIAETGFASWGEADIASRSWYPFGRDIELSAFPGLPFSSAALFFLLSGLGIQVTILDVCIIFPVLMAAITCITAFFLGREIGGNGVGLLSALFLAINPAYIGRTYLGFFDDESVGILGILLLALFFLRSLNKKESLQVSVGYSVAAGLSLGYVFASWGAARYPLSLLALFIFVLVILGKYSRRLLSSYGVLLGVSLLIAVAIPRLGLRFLTEFDCLAAIGVFLILILVDFSQRFPLRKNRIVFLSLSFLAVGVTAMVLWYGGLISLPVAKFIGVINPLYRMENPLVESVQEHRPATWASYYYQFGMLTFLAPLGIVFVSQKISERNLFMVIYAITTMYFSASLIRLTILLAPAMCILGSLAIVKIITPFTDIATRRSFTRRRLRLSPRVGRIFSVIFIIALFALTLWPMTRGVDSAYTPTTLISSSMPVRAHVTDWPEALIWMKENLEEDAVVASWWDYGYWITVVGEKITLADNGTINSTQIARIGRMFMSNETQALVELKSAPGEPPGYVVVFTTIGQAIGGPNLFGDEVKWRWMAKIGWDGSADVPLEDTSITSQLAYLYSLTTDNQNLMGWYQQFASFALPKSDSVLTKLMIYGELLSSNTIRSIYEQIPEAQQNIEYLLSLTQPQHFQLLFASSGSMVFIYKVLYD